MKTTIVIALMCVGLAGCVTPEVLEKPSQHVDFHSYKTVSHKVHAVPTTEYGSDADDLTYGHDTIGLIDTLLGKKLADMGYAIAQPGATADLTLDVEVTAVKPGSAAAPFWVGFGAGRALLQFEAAFANSQGQSLGKFEGGRSYTGMEFGKGFANRGEIETFAATRAVAQVEEFMTNGGAFAADGKAKQSKL